MGANTGRYSRIAADAGYRVVALDIDPAAVERGYRAIRADGRTDIMPMLGDVTDPSPGLGWDNTERSRLLDRVDADVVLALALVHHLAIGANVPLPMIASLFAQLAPHAIVEFVPKEDAMVQRLLATRRDVFPDYDIARQYEIQAILAAADGIVTFVENLGDERRVPIQPQHELRHVVGSDGHTIEVIEVLIGEKGVRRKL